MTDRSNFEQDAAPDDAGGNAWRFGGLPPQAPAPGLTPPTEDTETAFLRRPKLGDGTSKKKDIPKGLWQKCDHCDNLLYDRELEQNLQVCHHCGRHFHITGRKRLEALVEPDSFQEMDVDMLAVDILEFTGVASYKSKLEAARSKTGHKDAVTTGTGMIGSHEVALAVMNFRFIGGSMGAVVGEKITRAIETGTKRGIPVIIISASGGARMYEAMFSLMQMAKTCGALAYHAEKKLPFISVLTNPTYAGVMASYASVGDLIIAEPGASIGFAGARVIKDTTQAELPEGFQTSEFLMDHGLIDAIIPRGEMKAAIENYLDFMMTGAARSAPAKRPARKARAASPAKAKAPAKRKAAPKARNGAKAKPKAKAKRAPKKNSRKGA